MFYFSKNIQKKTAGKLKYLGAVQLITLLAWKAPKGPQFLFLGADVDK